MSADTTNTHIFAPAFGIAEVHELMDEIQAGASPTVAPVRNDDTWIQLHWRRPGHPQSVKFTASLEHDGWAFYLMELLDNEEFGRPDSHCVRRWRFDGHYHADAGVMPFVAHPIDTPEDRARFVREAIDLLNMTLAGNGFTA